MTNGVVKWFNNANKSDGYKTLNEGQSVSYEAEQGPKGYHAVEVMIQDTT